MALFDRFGRLQYGSEAAVKSVLEYVVFEQYLSSSYGRWRMHAKIIPDWAPPKESVARTFVKPEFTAETEEERLEREKKEAKADEAADDESLFGDEKKPTPKESVITKMWNKMPSVPYINPRNK